MSHHRRKRNVRTVHARNDEHIYVSRNRRGGGDSAEGWGWLILFVLAVGVLGYLLPYILMVLAAVFLVGIPIVVLGFVVRHHEEIGAVLTCLWRWTLKALQFVRGGVLYTWNAVQWRIRGHE